ncbi:zinc-finger of the MIZ type in Nse subunit-domain-containing protein [Aspergillus aurantiobrunneus]
MLSTPGPSRVSQGPSSSSSKHRDRGQGRDRGATATATPRRAGTPPLPAYEPPIAPLNEQGRQALVVLLRSQGLRNLKTHIQHAETKLTDSAGEVNERLTDAKVRAKRRREREISRSMTEAGDGDEGENGGGRGNLDDCGDGGGNAEEAAKLRELEERVEAVTGRLDATMRRAIDSEVRADRLGDVLGALQAEVDANATANASGQRQRPRRRTRRNADEEDGDQEDGDLYEATPEPEVDGEEISLRHKLGERMAEDQAKWQDLSLTERYSKNNDYIGFYRIIHEAKHPGDDIPPLPNPSTWFAHLEDPNASTRSTRDSAAPSRNTRQQRSASSPDSDSDDLAIERERISHKCPLTLLPFRDPVTSTKCPHSFERDAITSMIGQSSLTVPAAQSSSGQIGRKIRAVKCPVCAEVLTNNDLRDDPVLLRRVRRAEAALKRDREEEEEADLGLSGQRKSRQSGIMLGSDDDGQGIDSGGGDPMDVDQVRIKQERAISRGVTEVEDENGDPTESETQDSNSDEDEDEDEE